MLRFRERISKNRFRPNTVVSVYNLGCREAAKPEIISEGDYKRSPRGVGAIQLLTKKESHLISHRVLDTMVRRLWTAVGPLNSFVLT